MKELRHLGEVRTYNDLHLILRARSDELGITRLTLDEAAGLTPGHASKILAPQPIKRLGDATFPLMLGALGLKLIVVEDEQALARIAPKLVKRERPIAMLAVGVGHGKHQIQSLRFLKKIAASGGHGRAAKLSARKRKQIAKNAARARWKGIRPVQVENEQ